MCLHINLPFIPGHHGFEIEQPQDDGPPLPVEMGAVSPQVRHPVGAVADLDGQFTHFFFD